MRDHQALQPFSRGKRQPDYQADFTGDSRHSYSRKRSLGIDEPWVPPLELADNPGTVKLHKSPDGIRVSTD